MTEPNARSTVLVVDDDPDIRDLLCLAVTLEGHKAQNADNGMAAIELVELSPPALIILDLMMPGMDGLRFLSWLRSKPFGQMPVITFTAMNDEESRAACLAAGATEMINKPVQFGQLQALLKRHLPLRRSA